MSYKVIPTPEFIKNLKALKKKYKNPVTIYSKAEKENILEIELKELIAKLNL